MLTARSYSTVSGLDRAEPKIETATPSSASRPNPSTNSAWMRMTRHGSVCTQSDGPRRSSSRWSVVVAGICLSRNVTGPWRRTLRVLAPPIVLSKVSIDSQCSGKNTRRAGECKAKLAFACACGRAIKRVGDNWVHQHRAARVTLVAAFAFPWDVIGDPRAAGRLRDLGADPAVLAAAYHSTTAITPRHPVHRIVQARHSAG